MVWNIARAHGPGDRNVRGPARNAGQPLVVALGVLTDLIQRGVPVGTATKSVLELTKAGIADEQLVAFRRGVERDVGLGAAPASAALLQAADFSASFSRDGLVTVPGSGRSPGTRTKP